MATSCAEDEKNVIQFMAVPRGPLEVMSRCITENIKVKVWTRNIKIRGVCIGYVEAFDKYWNLVLRDVEEVYLKRRKGKAPYLCHITQSGSKQIPEEDGPKKNLKKGSRYNAVQDVTRIGELMDAKEEENKSHGVNVDETQPKRQRKPGTIVKKRYIKKLFCRGNSIISICLLDS